MKKIFSFVVVLCAVALVSCAGNANKNAAAEAEATETVATEVVAEPAAECCDSTKTCCEACDSTKTCCEQAEGECCNK